MRAGWIVLFLAAGSLWGSEPGYQLGEGGMLSIGLPRRFLEMEKVREQLDTGLTTTFAFRLQARGGGKRHKGGARVDIRFEPWDRIYFITVIHFDGRLEQLTLASFERLVSWFEGAHTVLQVLDTRQAYWVLHTTIDILPFSQREAERTQEWFHHNLANQSNEKRDPNRVLDLLVASSIRRKSLLQFAYKQEFYAQ